VTEYETWVQSLAEGDEVAVLGQLGAVEDEGYRRAGRRAGWRSSTRAVASELAPATPERRAEAERSALVLWLLDVAAEAGRGGSATTTEQLRAMRVAHAFASTLRELVETAADAPCANRPAWDAWARNPDGDAPEHPAEGPVLCYSECAACRMRVLALALPKAGA
jgi:hypothetical protein